MAKPGNIPDMYWDKSRTPNSKQYYRMLALIENKQFTQTGIPNINGNFEFVMEAIDYLGDTRHFDTEDLIDFMENLPNLNSLGEEMKKILAGLGVLLIVLISVAAVVGCSNVKPQAHPVTPTPATDPYTVWYGNGNGQGYTDFTAVKTDLDTLNTDTNNGDVISMQADGTQLAADAETALHDPIPLDSAYPATVTGDYVTMMGAYEQAGQDVASGNYTGATTVLDLGASLSTTITTALNNAK